MILFSFFVASRVKEIKIGMTPIASTAANRGINANKMFLSIFMDSRGKF
jgi:hypothetical protein